LPPRSQRSESHDRKWNHVDAMEHKPLEPQEISDLAVSLMGELHLFFSRIEAKSSVILGVNTGMIWYLATKLPPMKMWDIHMLAAALPLALIGASMWQLYKCSFPHMSGARESLVSLKAIAKRTEDSFLAELTRQTPEELAQELLRQVWHSSGMLTTKIDRLKKAYTLCACAVLAWGFALAVLINR
jgi:hypothetical protein